MENVIMPAAWVSPQSRCKKHARLVLFYFVSAVWRVIFSWDWLNPSAVISCKPAKLALRRGGEGIVNASVLTRSDFRLRVNTAQCRAVCASSRWGAAGSRRPRWSGVRWASKGCPVRTSRQSAGWRQMADPLFPGLGAGAQQDQHLVLVVPTPRADPSDPAAGGVVQGDHPRAGQPRARRHRR